MNKIATTIAVMLAVFTGSAFAFPGAVFCAFAESRVDETLIQQARMRIHNAFSTPASEPTIFSFQDSTETWPFTFNAYGSTHFLPWKTCLILGPKGQNIDVAAHELMHAEVVYRVGYLNRNVQMPVWFDEGLAMQVDQRPQYDFPGRTVEQRIEHEPLALTINLSAVKRLQKPSDFYVSDNTRLTWHYAASKHVVGEWLKTTDASQVFSNLERNKPWEAMLEQTETVSH